MKRSVLALTALSAIVLLGTIGCNLVPFDEDYVQAARTAADFTEVLSLRLSGWDEYSNDDDLLVPDAFFPVSLDTDSGYLVGLGSGDGDSDVRVWWVEGDSFEGVLSTNRSYNEATIDAFIVPTDPDDVAAFIAANPDLKPPQPILLLVDQSKDSVNAQAAVFDTSTQEFGGYSFDLSNFLTITFGAAPDSVRGLSVTTISGGLFADEGAIGLISADGVVLSILDETTSILSPRFFAIDQRDLANYLISGSVPAAGISYTGGSFPVIPRSDGENPWAYHYAVGLQNLTGYLSFLDDDYAGAPIVTVSFGLVAPVPTFVEPSFAPRIIDYSGFVRGGRSGSFPTYHNGTRGSDEIGAFYYLGQYVDGTDLVDTYSVVSASSGIIGLGTINIAVYRD